MSYRNHKPAPAPDMRAEGVEEAWLDWIEGEYGVVLGDGQLYADNTGKVYAGSEYVATLSKVGGQWQLDPAVAHSWTEGISHRPRGTRRGQVAYLSPLREEEDLQAHYDRNADATGHDPRCHRRVIPTMRSDSKALDPERCARCRQITDKNGPIQSAVV